VRFLLNLNILYSFLRFLFIIVVVVTGIISIYFTSKVTYPFIFAIIIAFLMNPLVNLIELRLKIPRGAAVGISLIILLGIFVGLFTLLISEMISGFNYLADVIPENLQTLINYLEAFFVDKILPLYYQLAEIFNKLDPAQRNTIMTNIESIGKRFTAIISDVAQLTAQGITNFFVSLPSFVTVLVFSLLATFFISKDWYKFKKMIRGWSSDKVAKSSQSIYSELRKALFGFVKAQFTLISITAGIVLIGLLILRVDYAITIAILIGLVDLLPYLGTGAVFIPWIVYSFFSEEFTLTIGLAILYAIVVVQRQVMEPKILSSSIGLDPLATLVALFVGFKLFGFLGLIIGPVILVIIRALNQANVFQELWRFIIGKKA
jgi:sporulation integral membrane protein YtvI